MAFGALRQPPATGPSPLIGGQVHSVALLTPDGSRASLTHDQCHNLPDPPIHVKREALAFSRMTRLDGVDDEARRERAESAREADRGGDAKRVSGSVLQRRHAVRLPRADPVDAAGGAGAAARIHDHHIVEAGPRGQERGGLAAALAHLEGATISGAQSSGDSPAGPVVAAVGVADADDEAGRQSSRRSSFRKCVAQEMQGS